ncbi:hypothetical protein bcgnr5378_04610 [Bacillus cereus]
MATFFKGILIGSLFRPPPEFLVSNCSFFLVESNNTPAANNTSKKAKTPKRLEMDAAIKNSITVPKKNNTLFTFLFTNVEITIIKIQG